MQEIKPATGPDYGTTNSNSEVQKILEQMKKVQSGRKMTLSVACITANEKSLSRMIKSVDAIADEIVIVSSGGFCENLSSQKIRQYERAWTDDFSAARNCCFLSCTGDYVLWMDSDDYLPKETADIIRAALDNPGPKTLSKSCYFCLRVQTSAEAGRPCGILQPRITPNMSLIYWKGKIHETHSESLNQMPTQLTPVIIKNGFVIHTGYDDYSALMLKIKTRNIPLLMQEPESARKSYLLALSYMMLKDYEHALELYQSIDTDSLTFFDNDLVKQIHYNTAVCLFKRESYQKALRLFEDSEVPEALYHQGVIHFLNKDYYQARMALEKYLEIEDKPSFWPTNKMECRYSAWNTLGKILLIPFLEMQKKAQLEFPKIENNNVLQITPQM